jgi:2-polyprenyl-3-methyl-5-hydroxy-6-metoxy-1,4-benzoquinol methylase
MSNDAEAEAERVRAAYARRAELGLDNRYAYWEPANLFIFQSRERAFLKALREKGFLPLTGKRVLDAGCGDGSVLRDLLRYGADATDLHGIDLLPERIERARELTPEATIDVGDMQKLAYENGRFDLVLCFTVLSSVTDKEARRRVVGELTRVTRQGGLIVVYDFRFNPFNGHVKALGRETLRDLFAGHDVSFYGTTLAPPLTRLLLKAPGGWLAATLLEVIPFLRTHYVAAISSSRAAP